MKDTSASAASVKEIIWPLPLTETPLTGMPVRLAKSTPLTVAPFLSSGIFIASSPLSGTGTAVVGIFRIGFALKGMEDCFLGLFSYQPATPANCMTLSLAVIESSSRQSLSPVCVL